MGHAADGQKRDDRAVVGHAVETAGGHRRHPMEQFRRQARLVCPMKPLLGHNAQSDGHAPRGRTGDAGEDIDGKKLETRGVPPSLMLIRKAATDLKPGREEMTFPYPTSEAVFMIASSEPMAPALSEARKP